MELSMVEFSSWNVECAVGTQNTQLYPAWSCYDRGVLGENGDMVFKDRGIQLSYGEFCIAKLEGGILRGDVFVQACMPSKKEKTMLPFYSYVLGISIFCLLFTMVIYITSPELTNPTNKIMLNFTVALFLAYLVLIFIQRPEILEKQIGLSRLLCRSLGHVEQFSFLSAFTWISIMSFENLNQLRGLSQVNSIQKSPNTMKKQMLIGYGIPLALSLVTGLVEMFAPECAIYKPRFGQRSVLF
jgi:G protein-coupled receptor Mth (Methuselah protein)